MGSQMNVLVLAPHTDDGEFGCGASVVKLLDEGHEVFYAAFSICEDSVPDGFPKDILESEVKEATEVLGIKRENLIIHKYPVRKFPQYRQEILEDMVVLNKDINPGLVFLPSSYDIHQDHNAVFQEGRRAFRATSLLGYEFMWDNFEFNTSCFYIVEDSHIETKIMAMDRYKSQEHRFYAKEKLIRGLASFRGLQISCDLAEAFEVIRWVIR